MRSVFARRVYFDDGWSRRDSQDVEPGFGKTDSLRVGTDRATPADSMDDLSWLWCVACCVQLAGVPARRRDVSDVAHHNSIGFILVVFGAIYFVANGMSILWLSQNETSGPDPISVLFRLSLLSFAVLVGVGLTLALKATRRCLILWAFSVVMITAVLCYNFHLLAETIASV